MSFDILLDSSLAKLERGGERNVSHDFTVNFNPSIDLGSGNYKAALETLITMSYSWNNIDSSYDNNKIRWKKKTESVWKTLTFPNGMYDYKRINDYIQQQTGKVDPTKKDSAYIFTIHFEFSTYRILIVMHDDYELDFSQGNFAELLGFDKKVLDISNIGTKIPNITRGVDWVYIFTAILSHAEQTIFQPMCYTVSQQQIFLLAIHFEKSRVGLSGIL